MAVKDYCDVCGGELPVVSEKGPEGVPLMGGKRFAAEVHQVPEGGARFYKAGTYVVCMNCKLLRGGIVPNQNLDEFEAMRAQMIRAFSEGTEEEPN